MDFIIEEKDHETNKCEYLIDEESLMTFGESADCSITINNTYLTIDFDISSKKIVGISGFIGNVHKLPSVNTEEIEYSDGRLLINSVKNFEKGIGYNFGIDGQIMYDKKKAVISIELDNKKNSKGQWYRIAKNIYALLENTELYMLRIQL